MSNAVTVSGEVDLTVDVTHGYRHFSFLTYIGVLYLAALRGVRVRGAYYGLLRSDAPSPFLDLRPLLALPRWIHALEVVRETGSTLPLAEALDGGAQDRSATARDIARDARRREEPLGSYDCFSGGGTDGRGFGAGRDGAGRSTFATGGRL